MTSNTHTSTNITAENVLQPIIYGVLPDQTGDEIDLGELFSRLISQWRLILAVTVAGSLLAVLLALLLPKVYQPAVTLSLPTAGDISPIINVNAVLGGNSITAATKAKLRDHFSDRQMSVIKTLLGGNNAIPATPQEVFNRYFNQLRSDKVLEKYINEKHYWKKLYPDSEKPVSTLFARLLKRKTVETLEPKPQVKGSYIENPQRVKISLQVKDEATGVSLLNGYANFVNDQLITNFQANAKKIIEGKVKTLSDRIATQREQALQARLLTIKKMEHENAKKIAQLQEQITSSLKKAELDRKTQIARAAEALKMAKTLGLVNPSTMDVMDKKGLKNKAIGMHITSVDKPSMPLYLYGSKYLTMLIKTLKSRKNNEVFLDNINNLKEKIYPIENDATLAALKNRKSDDPWISGLAEELAQIDTIKKLNIKNLTPDFSTVRAYTMDNPAIVTGKSVKPKRKLIVGLGFILSLFIAIFVALVVGAKDRAK